MNKTFGPGRARWAVPLSVFAVSGIAGCGSDSDQGARDVGGDVSSTNGGMSGSGGTSSGGGSGGSAARGGSEGNRVSGGGSTGFSPIGGAGGGGHAGAGGSDNSLPGAALDGGTVTDAGADGDVSTDGGAGASGDRDGSPCPIPIAFPLGTYHLEITVSTRYTTVSGPGSLVEHCSLAKSTATLTLQNNGTSQAPAIEVRIDSLDLTQRSIPPDYFNIDVTDTGAGPVHVSANCVQTTSVQCGLDDTDVAFDIDRDTGVITNFDYSYLHFGPYPTEHDDFATGAGWPICAASTVSPPTSVPFPPNPSQALCQDPPALGCHSDADIRPSAPQCPVSPGSGCTCSRRDDGQHVMCCAP